VAIIVRSPLSVRDYEDIWLYIARDNIDAADRLIRDFERHLAMLANMPGLGRAEDDLAPSLRSFPVGSYLLYYLPADEGIRLVRVLHGARDINQDHFVS
jgi:toxin ParE1/3/4